ncbi:hypothetical protein CLUG_05357 [Clavispora lusitaniae ATCC 42720]|uniref:Uncharacterized protein n=1 Tax=Clavispora lusitaniae (strain ATCC 42720) TaxID=306902 RepID=C4YB65_CLAL4|nr:uncharacterized protein CLUG_05357 [Clavispora lusitaniae ATCC 42720]EEQ41229.1 hypothetical protein CLUG_05357 [Clavispora lusitaniae ATCC 42720]
MALHGAFLIHLCLWRLSGFFNRSAFWIGVCHLCFFHSRRDRQTFSIHLSLSNRLASNGLRSSLRLRLCSTSIVITRSVWFSRIRNVQVPSSIVVTVQVLNGQGCKLCAFKFHHSITARSALGIVSDFCPYNAANGLKQLEQVCSGSDVWQVCRIDCWAHFAVSDNTFGQVGVFQHGLWSSVTAWTNVNGTSFHSVTLEFFHSCSRFVWGFKHNSTKPTGLAPFVGHDIGADNRTNRTHQVFQSLPSDRERQVANEDFGARSRLTFSFSPPFLAFGVSSVSSVSVSRVSVSSFSAFSVSAFSVSAFSVSTLSGSFFSCFSAFSLCTFSVSALFLRWWVVSANKNLSSAVSCSVILGDGSHDIVFALELHRGHSPRSATVGHNVRPHNTELFAKHRLDVSRRGLERNIAHENRPLVVSFAAAVFTRCGCSGWRQFPLASAAGPWRLVISSAGRS